MPIKIPPVQFDTIVFQGGLDQVTPTLSLKNGFARESVNFEAAVTGGYTRIAGYERFDGHTSPSSTSNIYQCVSVSAMTHTPVVGETVTGGSSGATGVIAYIDGLRLVLTKISGTFTLEAITTAPDTVGTIDDLQAGPDTPYEDAVFTAAMADIYRADISAVPGSGPVRGVMLLNGTVYAMRNNAGGTAKDLYAQSGTGWTQVTLLNTVSFTGGGTATPVDGAVLTQGGVTATIKRVCLQTGAWTGTAAGRFVVTNPAGGNFTAGAATVSGGATVTLSGAQSAITIAAGGKVEYEVNNFFGGTTAARIYGCDNVGNAFEFDGTTYAPIIISSTVTGYPKHLAVHIARLFLALGPVFYWSEPGNPFGWTVTSTAGYLAAGDTITGMVRMPGAQTTAALAVFLRSNTQILYGSEPADFNFTMYNTGSGAVDYSVQNMSQTLAFDDRGAVNLQATLTYGNFVQASLTSNIIPFVEQELNLLTGSTLNRQKSQYRVFFSDKNGLYITIVNGKLIGCMPVVFADDVYVATEGKSSTGEQISFFGSSDGFVYQMDKGTSFDGDNIEYFFIPNYASARNSRIKKRYRRAALELIGDGYVSFQFGYQLGYDSDQIAQAKYADVTGYYKNARWDVFTWDAFFWDSNSLGPAECQIGGTAENIAMVFYGANNYVKSFTLNSAIIHYTPRRVMR